MKAAVKKRWLKALRSGKYKQGHSELLSYDEEENACYCCLGVLLSVEGMDVPECEGYPDADQSAKLGIPFTEDGNDMKTNITARLAAMNDAGFTYVRPQSFKQIANYIERNL